MHAPLLVSRILGYASNQRLLSHLTSRLSPLASHAFLGHNKRPHGRFHLRIRGSRSTTDLAVRDLVNMPITRRDQQRRSGLLANKTDGWPSPQPKLKPRWCCSQFERDEQNALGYYDTLTSDYYNRHPYTRARYHYPQATTTTGAPILEEYITVLKRLTDRPRPGIVRYCTYVQINFMRCQRLTASSALHNLSDIRQPSCRV